MLEACGDRIRSVVGLAASAVTLAVTAACSGSSSSPSGLHGASPSALALSPPGSPASAFPTGPPRTPAAGSSSATPHTQRPSAMAMAMGPPMSSEISQILSRTVETADPSESFAPSSPADIAPVTVSDGQGGTLTAGAPNLKPPPAGHGAPVFFWHHSRCVRWGGGRRGMTEYRAPGSAPGALAGTLADLPARVAPCRPP